MKTIIRSQLQTKQWRKDSSWYKNGKCNECEIYQRLLINNIIGGHCAKTSIRINMCDYRMQSNPSPMKKEDGFDWTEDFDGCANILGSTCYFNFKMVCGAGGAQTRTLREVYHFIKGQLLYLLTYPTESKNVYFVNILDGDASHNAMPKMNYLINQSPIKNRIYVGDLYHFQIWYYSRCAIINPTIINV